MKRVLIFIISLPIVMGLDLLLGYLLNTIALAGIIFIPYFIGGLIYLIDKEEKQNDGSTS